MELNNKEILLIKKVEILKNKLRIHIFVSLIDGDMFTISVKREDHEIKTLNCVLNSQTDYYHIIDYPIDSSERRESHQYKVFAYVDKKEGAPSESNVFSVYYPDKEAYEQRIKKDLLTALTEYVKDSPLILLFTTKKVINRLVYNIEINPLAPNQLEPRIELVDLMLECSDQLQLITNIHMVKLPIYINFTINQKVIATSWLQTGEIYLNYQNCIKNIPSTLLALEAKVKATREKHYKNGYDKEAKKEVVYEE